MKREQISNVKSKLIEQTFSRDCVIKKIGFKRTTMAVNAEDTKHVGSISKVGQSSPKNMIEKDQNN